MSDKILYLVIPCYNEEEILNYSALILKGKLEFLIEKGKISNKSKILFVDDGSYDKTWEIICHLNKQNKIYTGIQLSKNEGHQYALLAGLDIASEKADISITIDADLQDDINAIDEMVDKANSGFDIVFGVRKSRKADSIFKKMTAELFYKIMNFLGAETIFNHADFRLMNKKAMECLKQFKETNVFLRGLVLKIGLKSCCVYYERKKRKAGKTKYTISKMISFAVNGVTSCSTKLIHFIFLIGVFFIILSLIMSCYGLIRLINGKTIIGWTSLMVSIWMLSGIILISLGIIGEYVGKIYMEVKKRPRYIISSSLLEDTPKN